MSLDTKFGRRKTVNMNEDVAQELNKLANLQGKTLYSLINEIGLAAIAASNSGFTLEDAVEAKKVTQRAKRSRMVLVNQDLWYFASSQAMRASKNKWLKLVRDSAQWQAKVFLTSASRSEFADSVKRLISDFFWDCAEVSFQEKEDGDSLAITLAFVPEMPMEHTQSLFKAFEGMFNAHGYVATDSSIGPGFVTLTLKKINGSASAK